MELRLEQELLDAVDKLDEGRGIYYREKNGNLIYIEKPVNFLPSIKQKSKVRIYGLPVSEHDHAIGKHYVIYNL